MHYSLPKKLNFRGKMSERYYVRVGNNGRYTWKCTGATTLAGAREIMEAWIVAAATGRPAVLQARKLIDVRSEWLAALSVGAARRYVSHLESTTKALSMAYGERDIRTITSMDLERLVVVRSNGLRSSSLCAEITQLKALFRWAFNHEMIDRDPSLVLRRPRVPLREVQTLTREEVDRLLVVALEASEEIYGWILALVSTGLRTATVSQLTPADIDWHSETWKIPAELMKSKRDYVGRPVPPTLIKWLREHNNGMGNLFRPVSRARFSAVAEKAGVSWLRPHDLRRTFITLCRERGLDLETTRKMSDHADLSTLIDRYRSVDLEAARGALM